MADVLTGLAAGLKQRLDTDTLTDEDRERMELARRVRDLRAEGKSFEQCGELLVQNPKTLAKFCRGGVYRLICAHFESIENGTDLKAIERVVQQAKADFAGLAPSAIAFLRSAMKRTEDGKEFANPGLAQWATNLIAKGIGLTEPQTTVRPVININLGVIKAELHEVESDDARAASALDITPEAESAGTRGESRERLSLPAPLPPSRKVA